MKVRKQIISKVIIESVYLQLNMYTVILIISEWLISQKLAQDKRELAIGQ